jgi:RNA polymerase sigma-70 factor (ECF subfamily)
MSIAWVDCAGPSAGYVPARTIQVLDETLIKQIARKNEAALQTLRLRHQGRVSAFILRFVRDRSLVEDLVDDTFFGAWLRAPYFENRSSVSTWLLSIARYKALSARERRYVLTEPLDDAMSATLVDPSLRADAVIEHKDTARYLQRCLATLSKEQALLIDLVYYRDKSVREAAVLAAIPENTVKSRMFQARRKLAVLLANAGH